MDFILYTIVFGVGYLVGNIVETVSEKKRKEGRITKALENLGKELPTFTGHRINNDEAELREQVSHLAKVQLLILKELGKEHHVEPRRDVLVSVKSKERG